MMRKHLFFTGLLCLTLGLSSGCQKLSKDSKTNQKVKAAAPYTAKDFSDLYGMRGFSNKLLQNHFTLYQGYVKNTNALLDQLRSLAKSGSTSSLQYAELKRRLGFEFNGMRLHEYYFGNLGGDQPLNPQSPLAVAIVQSFGSFDQWQKDFIATGKMRGSGWVILYLDPQSGRLLNFWITDHQINHPAGCVPILVMDVWEHAYMLDYQLDRGAYIDAFLRNVDWTEAARRYDRATAPVAKPHRKISDTANQSLLSSPKLPSS